MYTVESTQHLYYHGDMPVYQSQSFETIEELKEYLDETDLQFINIYRYDDEGVQVFLDENLDEYYYFPEPDERVYLSEADNYEDAYQAALDAVYEEDDGYLFHDSYFDADEDEDDVPF